MCEQERLENIIAILILRMSTPKKIIEIGVQEFGGTLLLFLLFFPTFEIFGNTWLLWILHFNFVILMDFSTGGAFMNPVLVIVFFLFKEIDVIEALTRIIFSIISSLIALNIVNYSTNSIILPLDLGTLLPTHHILYYEFISTFILTIAIMLMPKFGSYGRPWIASVFRFIDYFLKSPCMNPLIGLAYFTSKDQLNMLSSYEFLIGFSLGPFLGGFFALTIWYNLLNTLLTTVKNKKNNKND